MKFTTYNIIYLISNFFTIFIIHRFMKLFFSKNNTNKFLANIAYLSYFIVTSLAYLLFDIPIITLALNWAIVFCISLMYESTMQKRMMYSTYIIVFMLFPELIVGAATGYLHFSFFVDGSYRNSIGVIVSKIMAFSEALLLHNYKISKEKQNVGWNLWLSSILIPISTLGYEIMFVSNNSPSQYKVITSVVILFVINISAFYMLFSVLTLPDDLSVHKSLALESDTAYQCKAVHLTGGDCLPLQLHRNSVPFQALVLLYTLPRKAGPHEKYKLLHPMHLYQNARLSEILVYR